MSPKFNYIIAIAGCLGILASCTQKQESKTAQPSAPKSTLMQPFRYHKLIESSPGKYFDVFSWGRGKDTTGSYLILRSDSTGKQFSTTSGDLEGAILDVYNTDMNMDGNPEILILAKAKDTTTHVNIYAYEFIGTKSVKLNFPKLSSKSNKGYRGEDNFYIKEGNLIREFPIYDGNSKNAKPTGHKKVLQYGLRETTFTIKDISPVDSTALKSPVKAAIENSTPAVDKPKSTTKAERHHRKEKHHVVRHKRHRHRREE